MPQDTKWPLALPHAETEFFLSIVCGNSHMQWAFHEPPPQSKTNKEATFTPSFFWKTKYPSEQDLHHNSMDLLNMFVAVPVQPKLCGTLRDAVSATTQKQRSSKHAAPSPAKISTASHHSVRSNRSFQSIAAQRRSPVLHVYVLATAHRDKVDQIMHRLFEGLPVCLWRLQRNDFVGRDEFIPARPQDGTQRRDPLPPQDMVLQGTYATMGLDRLASVRAALELYGAPTLVLDGGTALTYTALDECGGFHGGGILAGVNLQLQALQEKTGALPYVSPQQLLEVVEQRRTQTKRKASPPLSQFAKQDTQENIATGLLYALADTLVGIVQRWKSEMVRRLEHSQQSQRQEKDSRLKAEATRTNVNKDWVVVVAGGDSHLMSLLLSPNHSGIIEPVRGAQILNSVRVINEKSHLCHLAVSGLLRRKRRECSLSNLQSKLIGQRIARSFADAPDTDGDPIFRATIAGVQDVGKTIDDDYYYVVYDDGQADELQIKDIYYGLKTYCERGEKKHFYLTGDVEDAKRWATKREQALETLGMIQGESEIIKAIVNPPVKTEQRSDSQEIMVEETTVEASIVYIDEPAVTSNKILSPSKAADTTIPPHAVSKAIETSASASKEQNNRGTPGSAIVPLNVDHVARPADAAACGTESMPTKHTRLSPTENNQKKRAFPESPQEASKLVDSSSLGLESGQPLEKKSRISLSSTAASSKSSPSREPPTTQAECESYIEKRICKYFGIERTLYFGTIVAYLPPEDPSDEPLWHVLYDDEDREDYTFKELRKRRKMYEKRKHLDPTISNTAPKPLAL